VFAEAPRYVGFGVTTQLPGSARAMRAHGYLPQNERRSIAERAIASIIAPSARALLEARGTARVDPAAALRVVSP
jgi:hypothetical protein